MIQMLRTRYISRGDVLLCDDWGPMFVIKADGLNVIAVQMSGDYVGDQRTYSSATTQREWPVICNELLVEAIDRLTK